MPRFVRIPLSGLAFLWFYSGAAVIAWILLPIQRWRTRDLGPRERQAQIDLFMMRCYRAAVAVMARLGLMDYELPVFDESALPPAPWVIVANHPTLVDVLFVKATLPGVCVLVKPALFRSPTLRRLFEASGDFKSPAAEERSVGVTNVLDLFVERLRDGRSVLVFPEGTRSPAWRMRRFRRGAAEAAIRAEVPIIPVFVLADPPVLKKGDKWYDMPKRVPRFELTLLPARETASRESRELSAELRDELAERLEAARQASVERHRRGP